MALVSLADAKADLRILGSGEDVDIQNKLNTAEAIVVDYLKRPDHGWTEESAPLVVKAAILLVLRNLFDEQNSDPITPGVVSILFRQRDPTLA